MMSDKNFIFFHSFLKKVQLKTKVKTRIMYFQKADPESYPTTIIFI